MAWAAVLVVLGVLLVMNTNPATAQITCFDTIGCTGNTIAQTTPEGCCLTDNGLSYMDGSQCLLCVVYGFASDTFVEPENQQPYDILFGIIKGESALPDSIVFRATDIASERTANTNPVVGPVDYTFGSTFLVASNRIRPDTATVTFEPDNSALEDDEFFVLELSVVSPMEDDAAGLNTDLPNVFFRNRQRFTIQDITVATFRIREAEISRDEDAGVIPIVIENENQRVLASDVSFILSPRVAVSDIRETASVAPDRRDFNTDTITLTFVAGGDIVLTGNVPITDDLIDEANEIFLVDLTLSPSSDIYGDRLVIGNAQIVAEIVDNDPIFIGFERPNQTFPETFDEYSAVLVKAPGNISEQVIRVVINILEVVPVDSNFGLATHAFNLDNDYRVSGPNQLIRPLTLLRFIQPEQQRDEIFFDIFDDELPELTEAAQLTITRPDDPTAPPFEVLMEYPSFFIIIEDDDRFRIGFENISYTVTEGIGSLEVCVRMFEPASPDTTIDLSINLAVETSEGTADENDYTPLSGFGGLVIFNNANRRRCVNLRITSDNVYEREEMLSLSLEGLPEFPLPGNLVLDPPNSIVTILDNTEVTIGFIDPPYSINEADTPIVFPIGVRGGTQLGIPISVLFSTEDGSAMSGEDYNQFVDNSIQFLPTRLTFDQTVGIINDGVPENQEFFNGVLRLADPSLPRVTIDPGTARAEIIDDDGFVIGFERTNYTVPEEDGMVEVCARLFSPDDGTTLTADTELSFTVDSMDGSAVSPADFGEIGGDSANITLTFNDANRRACFNVMISVDNVYEPDEMFYLDLIPVDMSDNVDVEPDRAHVEITDTTDLTIGFINDPYTAREDQGPMVFMVGVIGDTVIDDDTEVMVTFSTQNDTGLNLAVAGVDYTTTGRTLTFDSETSLVNVDVPITNDDIYEGDESFQGNLVLADDSPRVTVSPDEAVATILDEDVITIGFIDPPYSALENEGPIVFTVGVIGGTVIEGTQVDVSFTTQDATSEQNQATAGVDYTSNSGQTLTFNPVTSTLTVSVPINDDNIFEPDEVFHGDLVTNSDRVVLSPDQAVATILNDEEQCLPLPAIPNGFILYSNDLDDAPNYDVGSIATYICNVGFTLIGNDNRECVDGGNLTAFFNRQAPFCQPQCNPLPDLLNGDINYADDMTPNYVVGTIATYMCNDGFTLIGNVDRECVDDGDSTASFNRTVPYCRPRCLELPLLANGVITYGPDNESDYEVGTIATYMCNSGFTLVGEFTDRECVDDGDSTASFNREAPMCQVLNIIRVNDTVIGDPLMTVPLYVQDKSSIMPLGEEDIVHLCFEVHGRADEYFNLVSDEDVSVNAHYERVQPDEDINIIDIIAVRAVDSAGGCHNITVDLDQCRASVDGITISDMYSSNEISVRRYPRRVRISVPNGGPATGLVMWVFCQTQTFWSTSRTNPDGSELTFQGDAIRFVIARGLNLLETSHGILGQFWNVPIDVAPYTGPFVVEPTDGVLTYNVTVNYPNQPPRHFIAWLQFPSWELERRMYCLYAGDAHASFIYEVPQGPVNGPVIEGTYQDYITSEQFDTEFEYTHFDASQCP